MEPGESITLLAAETARSLLLQTMKLSIVYLLLRPFVGLVGVMRGDLMVFTRSTRSVVGVVDLVISLARILDLTLVWTSKSRELTGIW